MHNSFQDFAKLKGIHLLKDDVLFIKKCLTRISYQRRRITLECYADTWLKGMHSSDIIYMRQNIGRRNANKYLRELVE